MPFTFIGGGGGGGVETTYNRYYLEHEAFLRGRQFRNMKSMESKDEDGMPIVNKEIQPPIVEPNPLQDVPLAQVKYGISFFKNLLISLRNGKSSVPISFKPIRPKAPINRGYTPVLEISNPKTYEIPFSKYQFYDQWKNTINQVSVETVPLGIVECWEQYRKELIDYDNRKEVTAEVPIGHVFKFLQSKLSNSFNQEIKKVHETYGNLSVNHWIREYEKFNKTKIDYVGLQGLLASVWNSNKYKTPNYHALRRSVPISIRTRLSISFPGSSFYKDILIFINTLYRIKYKVDMPENLLFHNTWTDTIDLGLGGIVAINHSGVGLVKIPKKYVDDFNFIKCACCETLEHEKRINWISLKHTKYVNFYSIYYTRLRVEKRQKDALSKIDLLRRGKTDTYYDESNPSSSNIINDVKSILNKHIFLYKSGPQEFGEIDEYGLNHKNLDEAEMPKISLKILSSGWPDTANRKKYVFVCTTCFRDVLVKPSEEDIEEARYLAQRRLKEGVLKRDWRQIIQKHGASPFDILKEPHFKLTKGESPNYVTEKYIFAGKGQKIKHKDATLYMGVELEMTPKDDIYDEHLIKRCGFDINRFGWNSIYSESKWTAANVINTFLKSTKMGILTEDSSTGNGFELVTLPGTHKWHIEEAWKGFFKEDYDNEEEKQFAPSSWVSGWINNGQPTKLKYIKNLGIGNRPICGIHIHVSRDAITPLQLGKIKYFLNTHKGFVEKIAGRNSDKYARFIPSKVKDGIVMKNNTLGNRADLDVTLGGRYQALNLNTGKPTFEFRIFRSNVSKAGFMKNIDFVHALVTWCGTAAPADEAKITVDAFCKWLETQRGTYKWLIRWLIHHKYISSVHKFNPKYSKEFDFTDDHIEKVAI